MRFAEWVFSPLILPANNDADMSKLNQFFNVIPSAGGEATILLYGEVGDWSEVSAREVVTRLLELTRAYNKIDIRINSGGGEVYCGLAIYEALRNSPADLTIYIDGIAASMAAIIALCGKPLYMSPYARLMLHNVSGGSWGNSKELRRVAEEMEQLQGTLAKMIAGRLGKTPEEIEATYFDGEDHWLTAQECLTMGLIDGIYSMDEDDAPPLSDKSTQEEIQKYFQNRLDNQAIITDDMALLDEIRKACPSITASMGEGEVVREVARLSSQLQSSEEENRELKAKLASIEAEQHKAILDAAVASGKITAEQRPHYESLLGSSPDSAKALLASLPEQKPKNKLPRVEDHLGGGAPAPKSKFEGKSWDELDRAGLLADYKEADFEGFKALFQAEFGTSYKE